MTEPHVSRFVIAYRRSDDRVQEELPLRAALADLQHLFGRPEDDPMYDAYRVTESQRPTLEKLLGRTLDLSRYEYFVEAWRDSN
jgi:hypothetical protein